jgi:hypothetical protein
LAGNIRSGLVFWKTFKLWSKLRFEDYHGISTAGGIEIIIAQPCKAFPQGLNRINQVILG